MSEINEQEISAAVHRAVITGVNKVLSGQLDQYISDLPVIPRTIVDYLESLGFEEDDMETEGHEWAWWIYFKKDDQIYCAEGCGYYGGFEFRPEK